MSRFHRRPPRHYQRLRLAVLVRDAWQCKLCGKGTQLDDPATTVDHIVPLSKGGANTLDNLRAAHHRCNSARRDRELLPFANISERWST